MQDSINLEINTYIILIMVLITTKSTRYATNSSFGETINKFQDCNIRKET